MRHAAETHGFTLAEVVLGGVVLAVAAAAILGAYVGQVTLNEHARNLSLAINDANRVIEQIRQQTASCVTPTAVAPGGEWNAWLDANGARSVGPSPTTNELVAVTCQTQAGGASACSGGTNPILVTVAVCWRHRGRTIGDCTSAGGLVALDSDGDGVFGESPAQLTTLVTCRG